MNSVWTQGVPLGGMRQSCENYGNQSPPPIAIAEASPAKTENSAPTN
jgi:hypothetical protein